MRATSGRGMRMLKGTEIDDSEFYEQTNNR